LSGRFVLMRTFNEGQQVTPTEQWTIEPAPDDMTGPAFGPNRKKVARKLSDDCSKTVAAIRTSRFDKNSNRGFFKTKSGPIANTAKRAMLKRSGTG